MFTGGAPKGVLAQGEFTITWLGSGEVLDGDDFAWAITNCWSQDDGELLDGTVTLEDYTESVDFNTGVLFNIGFGGLGAEDPGPKACTRLSPAQSDGALVATVAAWSAIEVIVRAFEQWPSWG